MNYAHQQTILDKDPRRTGLFLGTGSGKTRVALQLAEGDTLVIAPKTQRDDRNWQREFKKLEKTRISYLKVISKEEFRRDYISLRQFDTVIVDEAHTCLGVTPNTRQKNRIIIPKASQLFDVLVEYLEKKPPKRLYLCTATIMKSPMTVWGAKKILTNFGDIQDFYNFRNQYYTKLPMPGREVYVPKRDDFSKNSLAHLVRNLGFVGRLEDFFDVPDQTFITRHIELTQKQKDKIKDLKFLYPDPIVAIGKRHQVENGVLSGDEFTDPELFENGKVEKIVEYATEFPRMVVFAKYLLQISLLEARLKREGYKVLTLTGKTLNRGEVLQEANTSPNCILIAQAQISAGWELPDYPVMIFASRTYSFVDYDQAIGRIQRVNNIKKNLYINLVVKGGIDEEVDKALRNKQDFNERLYAEDILCTQ